MYIIGSIFYSIRICRLSYLIQTFRKTKLTRAIDLVSILFLQV